MNYEDKTKGQLVKELLEIRKWIGEQATLETTRRQAEEIAKTMLDNVVMGIAMISPKMEIIWLNKTFKVWFPNIDIRKRPLCFKSFYSPPKKEICNYCPTIKAFKTLWIYQARGFTAYNG